MQPQTPSPPVDIVRLLSKESCSLPHSSDAVASSASPLCRPAAKQRCSFSSSLDVAIEHMLGAGAAAAAGLGRMARASSCNITPDILHHMQRPLGSAHNQPNLPTYAEW